MKINTGLNGRATFPVYHRAYRVVWRVSWFLLASWTPPQFRGWRRFLLRLFGAEMAPNTGVRGSAKVWYPPNLEMKRGSSIGPRVNIYNVDKISISEGVVVSQDAHLCTASHSLSDEKFLLRTKPIYIEAKAWICAEAFIGPGVVVGCGAVLGARGAAFEDMDAWKVYRGNPAQSVSGRSLRETVQEGNQRDSHSNPN